MTDGLLGAALAAHREVAAARRSVEFLVARRAAAIASAREAGASWARIGEALGVSAQRAQYMARQADPDQRLARNGAAWVAAGRDDAERARRREALGVLRPCRSGATPV